MCIWFLLLLVWPAGIVYRRKNRQTRVVVTSAAERDAVLDKAHRGETFEGNARQKEQGETDDGKSSAINDETHCDVDASVAAIKAHYFWKGIKLDVTNWVR
jgi:hypothetical protein